jgi:hypothetical protein
MNLELCNHYTYHNGSQLDGHSFEVIGITELWGHTTYEVFMDGGLYYISQEAIDDYARKDQIRHDTV